MAHLYGWDQLSRGYRVTGRRQLTFYHYQITSICNRNSRAKRGTSSTTTKQEFVSRSNKNCTKFSFKKPSRNLSKTFGALQNILFRGAAGLQS